MPETITTLLLLKDEFVRVQDETQRDITLFDSIKLQSELFENNREQVNTGVPSPLSPDEYLKLESRWNDVEDRVACRYVSRVNKAFQTKLPLSTLFDAPTVASLAERIEQARFSVSDSKPSELLHSEEEEGVIE